MGASSRGLGHFVRHDRCVFAVGNDFAGAVKAYKSASRQVLLELKMRSEYPKASAARRAKALAAARRRCRVEQAVQRRQCAR